jgi:hypothetical protein
MPAQLPFVGRTAEAVRLEEAWCAGSAIVIEGEGGVGKTRLALDFASAHGPYALARCRSGDADIPYASFARALRTLAGPNPELSTLPAWVSGELTRLLPQIGPAPRAIRSGEERKRLFEGCALGWCFFAVDEFDAIVLDDWHHADAASRALLAFVAQRRREVAPLSAREVVLLRPDAEPAATGAPLAEGSQALHLALPPLGGDAVFELVRQLSGAESPQRFAGRLQRATGGNPFFLVETLRQLIELGLLEQAADGVWCTPFDDATDDYRELPLPASVRDAVLSRVRRLDAACIRVLEAAALAGDAFAPSLLARPVRCRNSTPCSRSSVRCRRGCCASTKQAASPSPTIWCSRRSNRGCRKSGAASRTGVLHSARRPVARRLRRSRAITKRVASAAAPSCSAWRRATRHRTSTH